ncbi:EAL domain-containing protein [Actinotalea sp. AC32]|nr:EAL domain-containing protein [Actinotalea sp. AC32]
MTSSPTLLVFSPSTGGYYFGALLRGVARELAAVGGRAVVVQTLEPGARSDEQGEAPDFAPRVGWDHADGVLSITSAVRGEYLAPLVARDLPVVVASGTAAGVAVPTAAPDNAGGTAAAVEHLVRHGHTRIGFVGNVAQRDVRDRYDAYVRTLERHGLRADPAHLLAAPDNGTSGGRAAGEAFLAAGDRPTALMVATDRNALGLLGVVQAAGVDVPGDVAVVGFDDIEASDVSAPPLTTVSQPFDEVGALATRLVLEGVGGRPVPATPHVAPASLVVRGSCGCRPGSDGDATRGADDPARAGDDARVGDAGTPVDAGRTAALLLRAVSSGVPGRDADAERLVDDVLRVVHAATPDAAALRGLLRRVAPRADAMRVVTRVLERHVRATLDVPAAATLVGALRDLQAGAFLQQAAEVEQMLDEQVAVDAGLLDTRDPRSLDWLAGTGVRGAVLATWEGDQELVVAGAYDPGGRLAVQVGEPVPVEQFPPASLVRTAAPEDRLVCFVVPVRTRERDWGLLALVTEIEATSARETYHHWSALLASALEQQALQAAAHASEQRHALAAEAARDGLWEVDVATGATYVSERGRELLGFTRDQPLETAAWKRGVHPDDLPGLRAAIREVLALPGVAVEREYRVTLPGHTEAQWRLVRALGVADGTGACARMVGSLSDVDPRKRLEERLRLGALYDEVTGLPNRRHLLDRLAQAVETSRRHPDRGYAVVFLDLDGFKLVNDSLGHLVGDQLLTVVADRLRRQVRAADTAARFGGDEFAVLLADPVPDEVLVIAHRLQRAIAEPVVLAGQEVTVTASIGITTSDVGYTDPEDVLRDADTAMYDAKATERGTASVFERGMHVRATGRLQERAELRRALVEGQFVVHYQPVVALDDEAARAGSGTAAGEPAASSSAEDVATGRGSGVSHLEALVRWHHPERGVLLPAEFLPALVDNGSVVTLGEQVLEQVCRQLAEWERQGATTTVAVNLSHAEFWAADLPERLRAVLDRHGVAADRIVLEVTEAVIMSDMGGAQRVAGTLRDLGVALHVDDFGTGHSSLAALRDLPVDALKIDGSFIRGMDDARTGELVRVVVELGRVLGLGVVAECVETADQAAALAAMGCGRAQGWFYGRAEPGDVVGLLLERTAEREPVRT